MKVCWPKSRQQSGGLKVLCIMGMLANVLSCNSNYYLQWEKAARLSPIVRVNFTLRCHPTLLLSLILF